MYRLAVAILAAVTVFHAASGCSNFRLKSSKRYHISARTNDQSGSLPRWKMITFPRNTSYGKGQQKWKSKYGAVYAVPYVATAGMNERGLSCDAQTLNELWSEYPKQKHDGSDLNQDIFCEWALGKFEFSSQVAEAIKKVNFWKGYVDSIPGLGPGGEHYTLRDRNGDAIVVEFLGGKAVVLNETLGVVTNQPNYDWHKRNIKHLKWKMNRKDAAISLPGGFYPDDRLLRIYLLLEGLPAPKTYRQAIMQTAHVLNSVIVPPGNFPGTDTPRGQSTADSTLFAFIYDHDSAKIYWTDTMNQNWQLLDLKKIDLRAGSQMLEFNLNEESSGWFNDMTENLVKVDSGFAKSAGVYS